MAVDYSISDDFKAADYTPIFSTVGEGGQVRQHGHFSFSRVYQAGHECDWSSYILETMLIRPSSAFISA